MPENDQPMWPSSDEDRSSSGARKTTPMSLPDPPERAPGEAGVPKVTGSEAPKGSWFAPNVAPEPVPGLNAPAEEPPPPPPPAKQDLADRLGSREPKRPAEAGTEYIRAEPPVAESTQFIEVKQPEQAPVVPVERNVWPAEQQERREEPQQQWREELQLWREEQQRREEQLKRLDTQRRDEPQRAEEPQQPSAQRREEPQRPDEPQQPWAQRRDEPQRPEEPQQPWAQRIELRENRGGDRPAEPGERRPGLPPEPPRGVVPSASAGSLARPQRIEPDGQRFDAEATVGIERPTQFPAAFQQQPQPRNEPPRPESQPPSAPPPSAEAPSAEEPPKKRRKGKLIALVVVVLLVLAGGGVAAAMPKVSNRLGLPWAPNAPKGDSPEPAAATRQLQGPDSAGKAPTANGVKSVLASAAGNSALGQLTGSVIDPVTGTVLWDRGSSTPVTPASTTKVLTSAAALLSLDHNLRLSTKIVQGADPGTVVLVGGGDTTITNLPLGTDSPLYPGGAHVDDLVAQVKKAAPGVKKVQVDLTLFKGATTAPGWEAGDAPSTYATQMSPVMADGGRISPKDNNSQRTANAGSALASSIASKLGASAGGQATAAKDAKVLGEVKSAPLTELVSDLMVLSDDVLAEAIARQVALANGEEASYAGGARATIKVLKDHGFDVSGVELSDGSGISSLNRIPARLLTQLLAAAAAPEGKNPGTGKLRPVLAGLPVAGGSGTLADKRFDTPASQAGRGWVRAKTGTLTGVNTLAGLVLDQDGRVLVFAFMSNGSDTDPGRDAIDVLATSLRKCGCA
ncbi:D-alanyl-D-alanine carboxypeptidase/D-alanyl-D-alanine-endopeptidase (penicillin-binding protein 4) [Amycolatopsis lexingtonensis]|uniref:D-alanyl-D-alanine carboxypeptidase/D-alanyl-D-alanine-endopeptidase (Penicillin-binding protein 4) n=1 Tax=Amycolatopsis lexingtonensis TaxID=218822 RepID=A0ABR9IAX8_9PSEU|nr:D-alanyl-D-alanine carboxypeptidase/D-alanyl-D-alanine-endopeptidase [Amycolatopsis lexingtonensis]MBE1500299.1 D-alanyl-D-alanine carboxypeptidase/D-alanyl-D-alanine-endopeptidase (penicillin-binding protein 4) [Amycolatopsis lexingtonensis]